MPHLSRTRVAVAATAAALACAAPAAAQAPAPPAAPITIAVTGTGTVTPTPRDRKSNASIAKAVRDARAAATPLALADGRARATSLAALSNLALESLVAISEGGSGSPFGFFPIYGQEGTFGPGRFCGTVRVPIFRRTAGGGRRVVRTRTRHTCRVPPRVTATIGMTFSATPRPPV